MRVAHLRALGFIALSILASACAPTRAMAPAVTYPAAVVDDAAAAREALEDARLALSTGRSGPSEGRRIQRMVELGMWDEAERLIGDVEASDLAVGIAAAELRFRQHRYGEARALVDGLLSTDPRNREALLLDARLDVRAWELPAAVSVAESLLQRRGRDEDAALLIGRVRLLQKRYDEALEWAERVQEWNAASAGAHLLQADVLYWNQNPAAAEPLVARALQLDPFDADARFSYGYAIWRRVDATQLDAMAAQWELALEIDPLHYVTHWHWGNGHTNLTYADYAQPEDSTVRAELAPADSLIAAGRVQEAVELARRVEQRFPGSVLPALLRGSAFYMAWEMDREARLDSAQAVFRDVLARKPHFGPAHNGLAAVIKQRQFTVLTAYDSLEAVIAGTPLPADPSLEAVFPDLLYYPGDRVARLAMLELGPSIAYLPLIERQGRQYRIPPLHHDLAHAMGRPYFRTATTFDNRQWMDIRGVGSGAAAIEYVERGAHQERNVLLHEFVHLFHGIVLTDAENRRVRELYHRAMAEGRTLDYYASNNESEFIAQAYPAYFSPVKVHPLNHKSMNTADDLAERDPATHLWVDSLVARQRRYLAGDESALASNWAQVYVNLSESAREGDGGADAFVRASALLDTAAVWDAGYIPAMLSRAALLREAGRFAEAEAWLDRAASSDPGYAPIYAARAGLVAARAREDGADAAALVDAQASLYRQSLELEHDLAERASLSRDLRELYASSGRLADAISVAEEYVATAPTISTYLRDRRDEADARAHSMRSAAGYVQEAVPFLTELVARKPQNYPHRAQLADALVMAGELDRAATVLMDAQRILRAGGSPSPDFAARIAEIRMAQGDTASARAALDEVGTAGNRGETRGLRLVRILTSLGMSTDAHRMLAEHPAPRTPAEAAELAFTRAHIAEWRGDLEVAVREYGEALASDPYHAAARVALVSLHARAGRPADAEAVIAAAERLDLQPGPGLQAQLTEAAGRGSP